MICFRYVEKNTHCHSLYRPYRNDLPSYLHNRPRSVIDTARQKIHLAEDTPPSHVRTTKSTGVFEVKSQDSDGGWYKVSFGNDTQPPSCECYSWKQNHFPCKHFFAIFEHFPAWGWDKLPDHFTNSPLLTLDEAVIGQEQPTSTDISSPASPHLDDNTDCSVHVPNTNTQAETNSVLPRMYANIPQKKCSSKALGSSCREILSEIRQLTFLIDDSNELANLKTDLQGVYQRLKELAPSDGGLQVERGETTLKKRKLPNTEHPHKKLRKIPKAQPKRSKFSGRHGSKAAIMKKTFKVHVEIPKENHNPVATTHGAATCTKVPVTSDKVTTPSNTTPAAAAQVPPECATRQAPITTPATDVQMSTGTRVLADANQVSPFIPELTTLTQESAAPATVPSTVTQSTIVPKTIPKVSTNQVPSSLNAAAQATTQIPATLTTKHATTTQVPPTQTTMPTDATNVPTPQATSIQVPANLVTVQPTATQILSTPKKAPKQAVPATKTEAPQQTPSYHTPVYTAKEIKMPSSTSGDPVTHCKIASSSHKNLPFPF